MNTNKPAPRQHLTWEWFTPFRVIMMIVIVAFVAFAVWAVASSIQSTNDANKAHEEACTISQIACGNY